MQAVVKIHLMSLESIFRLQSFVKTKDAFKIVHQQSTEADQNEQKYQQLLLRLEISLLKKPGAIMFVSATPPSSPPVASPSLGVIPLVHPRHRVQTRQAAEGDHPALLQPLEVWIVILPPPRILTKVKEEDFQH